MTEIRRALRWIEEYMLSAFKYLLAVFMIIEGFETMFSETTPMHGALGFVYSSRATLVAFGIIFLLAGLTLLVGKIRRSKATVGTGLMSIYLCFLFVSLLQFIVVPTTVSMWLPNFIGSMVVGSLWLRWKYKTTYINPNHFRKRTEHLRDE